VNDDKDEEDLFVWPAGSPMPSVMHSDGTYVKLPERF
jgi:hypothetical protein